MLTGEIFFRMFETIVNLRYSEYIYTVHVPYKQCAKYINNIIYINVHRVCAVHGTPVCSWRQ